MGDVEPDRFRVSDAERQTALDALGEHLSSGRLDVDEFGERTARVTTAKTRGEVTAVFADLPEPRPRFGSVPRPAAPQPVAPTPGQRARPPAPGNAPLERAFSAALPLSAILALVMFLTVLKTPLVFLLPVVVLILGGAVLGDDWRNRGRRPHRGHWHH